MIKSGPVTHEAISFVYRTTNVPVASLASVEAKSYTSTDEQVLVLQIRYDNGGDGSETSVHPLALALSPQDALDLVRTVVLSLVNCFEKDKLNDLEETE